MLAKGNEIHNLKTGQIIRFIKTGRTTNDELLEMEASYPAGSQEPPVHYHPRQEEVFRVISGEMTIRLNNEVRTYKAGSLITIKAGDLHSMWNTGQETAVLNWRVSPSMKTEEFLRIMTLVANSPGSNEKGIPDTLTMLYLLNRYQRVIRLTKPARALVITTGILLYPLLRNRGKRLMR